MWQRRGNPRTYQVTNRLASEWAALDSCRVDRPLKERRLQVYERMVRSSEFRPVEWARAYVKETGQWYRVNGQHTSTLFSRLPTELLAGLIVVVTEFDCDTLEDLSRLYSTFDSQLQIRHANDVYRSFAAAISDLADVSAANISLAVAGLAWEANPLNATAGTAADRAERLFDNVEPILWMHDILSHPANDVAGAAHLRRAPVVGVMFGGFRKNQAAATEFWTLVRDETGATPLTPDRQLAKFLSGTTVNIGTRGRSKPDSKMATQREFYVRSIIAWNAWRAGVTTKLKYFPDAKIPTLR